MLTFKENNKFCYLWGMPILITKLDPKEYNKQEILKTITDNYDKDPDREVWASSSMGTNIHHSLEDINNKNFPVPDYTKLIKAYQIPTHHYIQQLGFNTSVNVEQHIVNYTASRKEAFFEPHYHTGCKFSMVHYVQFNPKENSGTVFMNPYLHNEYWQERRHIRKNIGVTDDVSHSWIYDEWKFPVEEDDIIIFPAPLKHYVKTYPSKTLRVTISMNIQLIDKDFATIGSELRSERSMFQKPTSG